MASQAQPAPSHTGGPSEDADMLASDDSEMGFPYSHPLPFPSDTFASVLAKPPPPVLIDSGRTAARARGQSLKQAPLIEPGPAEHHQCMTLCDHNDCYYRVHDTEPDMVTVVDDDLRDGSAVSDIDDAELNESTKARTERWIWLDNKNVAIWGGFSGESPSDKEGKGKKKPTTTDSIPTATARAPNARFKAQARERFNEGVRHIGKSQRLYSPPFMCYGLT